MYAVETSPTSETRQRLRQSIVFFQQVPLLFRARCTKKTCDETTSSASCQIYWFGTHCNNYSSTTFFSGLAVGTAFTTSCMHIPTSFRYRSLVSVALFSISFLFFFVFSIIGISFSLFSFPKLTRYPCRVFFSLLRRFMGDNCFTSSPCQNSCCTKLPPSLSNYFSHLSLITHIL